jgi:hypothetical protein
VVAPLGEASQELVIFGCESDPFTDRGAQGEEE